MGSIDLRTAAQQALEALELVTDLTNHDDEIYDAITALRAALTEFSPDWDRIEPLQENLREHMAEIQRLRAKLAEPVEPVAWTYEWKRRVQGGSLNVSRSRWPESDLWIETPLYAAPPQRNPLSVTDLQEALVYANLIDRDAIDDPEGYDEGSTLAQIDALHQRLTA